MPLLEVEVEPLIPWGFSEVHSTEQQSAVGVRVAAVAVRSSS
jgi:hypothetical protein